MEVNSWGSGAICMLPFIASGWICFTILLLRYNHYKRVNQQFAKGGKKLDIKRK